MYLEQNKCIQISGIYLFILFNNKLVFCRRQMRLLEYLKGFFEFRAVQNCLYAGPNGPPRNKTTLRVLCAPSTRNLAAPIGRQAIRTFHLLGPNGPILTLTFNLKIAHINWLFLQFLKYWLSFLMIVVEIKDLMHINKPYGVFCNLRSG